MTRTPVATLVDEGALAHGSSTALVGADGRSLSHAELLDAVRSIRNDLNALGVEPGSRIVIGLPLGFDAALSLLGAAAHGSCMPVDPATTPDELDAIRRDVIPSAVMAAPGAAMTSGLEQDAATLRLPSGSHLHLFRSQALCPIDREPLVILNTSGSTGLSKRVPQRQSGLVAAADQFRACFNLARDDRGIGCAPLFHGNGLFVGFLPALISGGSYAATEAFEPEAFLRSINTLSPTWFTTLPTQVHAMLRSTTRPTNKRLRFVRVGSSHLPREARLELEAMLGVPVIQGYGAAEAAHITSQRVPPNGDRDSVGSPCGNEVIVVDDSGSPVGPGSRGEVWVRGPSVIGGYLGDPENDASFADGWWRTGDIGAFDDDGYLTLCGRVKHTINRGGETIAPQEVETVLMAHPSVSEAVVVGIPHATLGEDLAAAVVLRDLSVDGAALRAYAQSKLPPSKIPSRIVPLEALPLAGTGKVRLEDVREAIAGPRELLQPEGTTETRVASIFGKVLGLEAVPANRHFLDLGGDSLSAARVLSEINDVFSVALDYRALLDGATPRGVASQILANADPGVAPPPPIMPRTHGRVQASTSESAIWLAHTIGSDTAYNVQSITEFRGSLDDQALHDAVTELTARHAAFRTGFETDKGGLWRLERDDAIPLSSSVEAANANQAFPALTSDEREVPFDPSAPPLARFLFVRSDEENAALILTLHHLICDAQSMDTLMRDLGALYRQRTSSGHGLSPLERSAADAAEWQAAYRNSEAHARSLSFWSDRLRNARARVDWPRAGTRTGRCRTVRHYLGADARSKPQGVRTTRFIFMQCLWKLVITAWTGQTDITFAAPASVRPSSAYDPVVGCFIETMAFRSQLCKELSLRAFVEQETAQAFHAYAHRHVPFFDVITEVRSKGGRVEGPGLPILFSSDEIDRHVDFGPELKARRTPLAIGEPPYDLTISVRTLRAERTVVELTGDDGVFKGGTLELLLDSFEPLLEAARADPDRIIGDLLQDVAQGLA